jgi:hypothetical protein
MWDASRRRQRPMPHGCCCGWVPAQQPCGMGECRGAGPLSEPPLGTCARHALEEGVKVHTGGWVGGGGGGGETQIASTGNTHCTDAKTWKR